MIPDGDYAAHMTGVEVTTLDDGRKRAVFEWTPDGSGLPFQSILEVANARGDRNHASVALAKGWAVDWKCDELDWFVDNFETCQRYPVKIHIRNGQTDWVCALQDWDVVDEVPAQQCAKTTPSPPQDEPSDQLWSSTADLEPLVFIPERLAQPCEYEPTDIGSFALFLYLTEGSQRLSQEVNWLNLVYAVKPRKRDMTKDDWQTVIDRTLAWARKNGK